LGIRGQTLRRAERTMLLPLLQHWGIYTFKKEEALVVVAKK
jgi:hypothetical protein